MQKYEEEKEDFEGRRQVTSFVYGTPGMLITFGVILVSLLYWFFA
jgi:hypothetical protein